MIIEFNVLMVGPGFYLVTAIMAEGPPVQVGLFENVEDIDEACEQFEAEYQRRLH